MVMYSKLKALCLLLLLSSSIIADEIVPITSDKKESCSADTLTRRQRSDDNSCDDDCDSTKLSIKKLCAKEIKAKCINACKIKAEEVCARDIKAKNITTKNINSQNDCTQDLQVANQACVNNLVAVNTSTNNLVAGSACINDLTVGSFQACTKYKAAAVYSALTTYTLGDYLNFDNIVDDPNGNLTTAPTTYTVPVTGYYLITMQIDQENLIPTTNLSPVLGVPVANPQIYVNGVLTRQLYSSYLTFFNQQRTTLTSISKFKAGDQIQGKLQVLAVNQGSGITELTGTVDIIGNGSLENDSLFIIHYLSSACENSLPCSPTDCSLTGCTGSTGSTGSTGHDRDCRPCDF